MDLRPTHLGYAYQDLLTALRLVDLAVGRAWSVLVDTKMFAGDRFDDITCDWADGGRERLQIKHTDHDRALSLKSFTEDRRGLRLDLLLSSVSSGLASHPGTSHRVVVRDTDPDDPGLSRVLQPLRAGDDPGPALRGLNGRRSRFDSAALREHEPWRSMLAAVDDDLLSSACASLVVDTGVAACSLNIREPGPAEAALLHRVSEELGAGRPPNRHRAPEDVALALIEAAKAARSRKGSVRAKDLIPRLGLNIDFGAAQEGHPVDRATEVTRPTVLSSLAAAARTAAGRSGALVVTGGPGIGKSWLCEQLGDALQETWVVARHHCWLGSDDERREQRVLTDVVIGSLLKQLERAVPEAVAQVRPRYAATAETLTAAVAAVRDLAPDRPVALIVDGIDHVSRVVGSVSGSAFHRQSDPAASLVEELAALALPPGVVLILASQPGPHLQALDERAERLIVPPLDRGELHALADRMGVLSALAQSTSQQASAELADAAVCLIEERSRGNALYATYLCRHVAGPAAVTASLPTHFAEDPLEPLRAVPSSTHDLDDYYDYLLKGLTSEQRHAVSMLAICDFAVTAQELGEIFPMPGLMLGTALNSVAPIVAQQPGIGGLKIHHESFSRFVRKIDSSQGWVDLVRSQAAAWLTQRGFFTDPRAFRHLPELLSALGRDDELAVLIGPDFLSRAIAGLQPPQAIVHTLAVAARRAASRSDWPTLVRCVELGRARATYEEEGLPGSLVPYADVLVALRGADQVAASLLYEGERTMKARWGLQLCAAVDRAGVAAPWEAYLAGWDKERDDRVRYGSDSDDAVFLAELRGTIRQPRQRADGGAAPRPVAQRVADFLDQEDLPAVEQVLGVLLECLGSEALMASVDLIERPDRRVAVLLCLADCRSGASGELLSARMLGTAAWASGPCDPRRLLRHGVAVVDLVGDVFSGGIDKILEDATREVLSDDASDLPAPVSRWLSLLSVAQASGSQAVTRLLPLLEGVGFYRAWLRFTIATLGLRRDVDAGGIPAETASLTARVALEQLAQHSQPFTGRPKASDLGAIHALVRQVLHEAVAMLREQDVAPGITSLQAISRGTTTSLMGMAGSGPLITTELVSLLAGSVGQAGAGVVHELMDTLRSAQAEHGAQYAEEADFELEMARVSLACGDQREAQECWERAARYMGAYGGHKDSTISELLDPLPQLLQAAPGQARERLARTQSLAYLVARCTDGRGTSGIPHTWWGLLACLDPQAAAQLGAGSLLADPGLTNAWVDETHHQLLATQADTADPVVLAALRIAAGPAGRSLDADIALLGRLADLPGDDAARTQRLLPVLANAITSTYDDQTLIYASSGAADAPTTGLSAAAQRCGGELSPLWSPKPVPVKRSRDWSGPKGRYATGDYLNAQQRAALPDGAAGVLAAVRGCNDKPYDAPPGARWSADGLANAVGWRVLEVIDRHSTDAAARLLQRIAEEMSTTKPRELLADIATGLRLRQETAPGALGPLAAKAGVLAFTTMRGGGGWRSFAGNDRLDLWQQAYAADPTVSVGLLADQVARAVADASYSQTIGVSQALVSAFAVQAPLGQMPGADALACWDAAYDVIAHRLPGDVSLGDGTYLPDSKPATQHDIDTALCTLAVAAIALPERGDKRRALLAATVLLASRPGQAQTALSYMLSFPLGAGPVTWILTVLRDHLPQGPLDAALLDRLVALCGSDMLSVRAEAAEILTRAGHEPPSPPATTAHPTLARAVSAAVFRAQGNP
ncbi:AAA family ATPase [Streptomyces sp. NPDC056374]|uniref:AAA family ATPase n=1 Tax=unclassified Streptomyces TaxID=2593676 RepID=UPI0035DEE0C2